MKKTQGIYLSLAITTLVVVAGCASSHFHSSRKPADEGFEAMKGNYDKLHPLYAVECASSKFAQKGEKAGGPYGHTFMYLKGACRDKEGKYPQSIKVCDPGPDPEAFYNNPENGVGLALDKTFKNTRYIATEGYQFLINGNVSVDAPLDNNAFEAAVRKLVSSGYAKGIELHQSDMDDKKNPNVNKGDPNMSDEEWIAREIIGSSFAVDFARNLGCVAVPINKKMLQAAVDYVNEQNEPFASGKIDFDWDGVSDQCVQFVNNVFASMGIGNHMITSSGQNFLVKGLLKVRDVGSFFASFIPFVPQVMPAPVNHLVKTDKVTNAGKILTLHDAYRSKKVRENFRKFDRLAVTDGVLIWLHSAHENDNEYFDVQNQLKAADFPFIPLNERSFKKVTEMPTATMVQDNLADFQARLQSTITAMDIEGTPIDSDDYCKYAAVKDKKENNDDFMSFCKQYTKYLHDAKADAASNADKLKTM